jgi:DNA-binding LytR/AlgR family response regulator
MKLKCVIIDDEPIARQLIAEFIADIDYLELLGEAENPARALGLLTDNEVDLIFLDINMPTINGINFLKNSKTTASIIMTTAYPQYAVEAFELDVLDYLVKPIPFERFLKACTKAKDAYNNKKAIAQPGRPAPDHFFIKCDNQIEKVLYDDLLYAESMMNYVILYTTSRKMIVYVTLKILEGQLPADRFVKVHKSFLVNRSKIQSIDGNQVNIGIQKIPISQNLREKVLAEILKDRMIRR